MKLCLISDTHNLHSSVKIPEGVDILIHCGDISGRGYYNEISNFMDWFSKQPARYKVLISGNHDFWFDKNHPNSVNYKLEDNSHLDLIPENVIYLQDSDVTIEGIKIWGSPVTPWFYNWAFNKIPEDLKTYWDIIPKDVDILVTHGPPANVDYLDRCVGGQKVGCPSLMKRIIDIKPIISAFGHIHEGYGHVNKEISDEHKVQFINCSVLNRQYELTNNPVIVELDENKNIINIT